MLKTVGAAAVLFAGGATGAEIGRLYSRRPREIKALMGALLLLQTQISYVAAPLGEALSVVALRADPKVEAFFSHAAGYLNASCGLTAAEAWDKAVAEVFPDSSLREEDLDVLRDLSAALGNSDREDQALHISLALERLKALAVAAEEDARRFVRLYRFLGFGAGLCLIVLLF
ncbi:MAG: stage III sporulation protein AB [Ammonifex sp.]|jgi:stage III sporulation protein AB|nr:MAG: stage III sporulation protein AB [Ammonifex sp.]